MASGLRRSLAALALLAAVLLPRNCAGVVVEELSPSEFNTAYLFNALMEGALIGAGYSNPDIGDYLQLTLSSIVGSSSQFGRFDDSTSTLGLSRGIILSTGRVVDAVGSNTSPDTDASTDIPENDFIDNDLKQRINADAVDPAAVTFGATVSQPVDLIFRLVFSSEEYNSFLEFKDSFALIVDGKNIAVLPNGVIVGVNNLNCGYDASSASGPEGNDTNCELFVNNDHNIANPPPFSNFQFNGFSVPIEIAVALQPGLHIFKFVIADAYDGLTDSSVFIESLALAASAPASNDATSMASIKSDPHLLGFRNQRYTFTGEVGGYYCLVSDTQLAINARFAKAYATGVSIDTESTQVHNFHADGTWIDQIGVRFGDSLISIVSFSPDGDCSNATSALHHGCVKVESPQGAVTLPRLGHFFIDEQLDLSLDLSNSKSFSRIKIVSTRLNLTADLVPPPAAWAIAEVLEPEFTHINIKFDGLKLSSSAIHGVLGQTMYPKYGNNGVEITSSEGANGEGLVAGQPTDYQIADLADTAFVFSCFGEDGLAEAKARAQVPIRRLGRRLFHEEGAGLPPVQPQMEFMFPSLEDVLETEFTSFESNLTAWMLQFGIPEDDAHFLQVVYPSNMQAIVDSVTEQAVSLFDALDNCIRELETICEPYLIAGGAGYEEKVQSALEVREIVRNIRMYVTGKL